MSSANVYQVSDLVSQGVTHLIGNWKSVILESAGKGDLNMFGAGDKYSSGKKISFNIGGFPKISRGETVKFSNHVDRVFTIRANTQRFSFSFTIPFDLTDSLFYNNRKAIDEKITRPATEQLTRKIEAEGAQYLIEHSPIIPDYVDDVTQPLIFPTNQVFDNKITNKLQLLKREFGFFDSYRMILNPRDEMLFSSGLIGVYNPELVRGAISEADVPMRISGFRARSTAFLPTHTSLTPSVDADHNVNYLTITPDSTVSEDAPTYAITATGKDFTLKAGDIIYYTAHGSNDPLYWWSNLTQTPVKQARFAFVVTSEKYIADKIAASESLDNLDYNDVTYSITAGSTVEVSLSHKVMYGDPATNPGLAAHNNVNRALLSTDRFYVMESHTKNIGVHEDYFRFKCFETPLFHDYRSKRISDRKTGFVGTCTHRDVLDQGLRRGNFIDFYSLPVFGAFGQNLFTIPVSMDAVSQQEAAQVSTISKAGIFQSSEKKSSGKSK